MRDPRVTAADNGQFLDLMERYFSQPPHMKQAEARPDLHFQVIMAGGGTAALLQGTLRSRAECGAVLEP